MDRLQEYLNSVERSLDVRTQSERQEIVAEIRDHVLECAAKFEEEGLDHEAAIERAIEQVGSSNLVAARISEAHDGASWRQAWLGAIPILATLLFALISMSFAANPRYLPFQLVALPIALFALTVAYIYLSPRHIGRLWRVPWLAIIVKSGVNLAPLAAFWTFSSASVGISRFTNIASSSETRALMHRLQSISELAIMASIVALLFVKKRRWFHVAFLVISLGVALHAVLTAQLPSVWYIVPYFYTNLLWLTLAYLLFIDEWKGGWTLAFSFLFVHWFVQVAAPAHTPHFWMFAGIAAIRTLIAGGAVIAAIMLPRKLALPAFLLAAALIYFCSHLFIINFVGNRLDARSLLTSWLISAIGGAAMLFLSGFIIWLLQRKFIPNPRSAGGGLGVQ